MPFAHRSSNVLVTGCSSGIGRAICDHLASTGWRVYGGSRTACVPDAWSYLPLDVTDEGSVARAVDAMLAREGHIDALVACAGRSLMGAMEDTRIEEAEALFDTNFFGTVRTIKQVLPAMRRQRAGKIVIVGSIGGVMGLPYLSFYSATKFALNGLAEALRLEVAPFGVQICVINPGDFHTNISANERHTSAPAARSPYMAEHRLARDLFADRVRNAPSPRAVAESVERLLAAKDLPVRRTVGSPLERLAVVAKSLLAPRMFEYLLRKNLGS
ncbi:MAG: SDR family oxidoreductase [Hyphomicrobiales bacterium]|nr:MAG: SDR family oxidoreductase [Hyphomicrobiales bacterium]